MSDIQFFSDMGKGQSQSSGICEALVIRMFAGICNLQCYFSRITQTYINLLVLRISVTTDL